MRSRWPKYQAEKNDSRQTIINPSPTAETKNSTQMMGLYHSGCRR